MRVHDLAEKARTTTGPLATKRGEPFGYFEFPVPAGASLAIIACDGKETRFDHVSVSVLYDKDGTYRPDRCPTWEEMCWAKRLFWDDEDCVIQYHPPKSQYVNTHQYVLHLWRPLDTTIPIPPSNLV